MTSAMKQGQKSDGTNINWKFVLVGGDMRATPTYSMIF